MSLTARRIGVTRGRLVFALVSVASAVLLAAGYVYRSGGEGGPAASPEPLFVPRPVTIEPGLHLLGAMSPSVVYVVETPEGLILIDAGLESEHELLLQQFQFLGLDVRRLKLILVTHGHGDHYLGALGLQRLTGAKIHAGKGDSQVLRDAGPREAVFSTFPMEDVPIHSTPVDVELVGGEVITLGDARLHVIATPGHTPGSVCYLLQRNGRTALFSGDTIMSIPGDLGTYSTYLPPRYRGDASDYLATFRELAQLPPPDLLLPGHPRTDLGTVSARISPQEWSSLLDRGILQMEQLTARYAADGRDFLDGNPKELLPGLYYLGDLQGEAVYCFAHQSSLVLIEAPGGPELPGFLSERLGVFGLDLNLLQAVVLTGSDPKSIAGLGPLTEQTGCRIIAAAADQAEARRRAPGSSLLTPEEAAQEFDWLPLKPVSIEGLGPTRTACVVAWQDRQVLLSGTITLKIAAEDMLQLSLLRFDPRVYEPTLRRLEQTAPDLWLPAHPVHGQNANLYDHDWRDVLREHRSSLGLGG